MLPDRRRKLVLLAAVLALASAAALAFVGYRQPALLLEMVGLRYCG